MKYDVYVEFHHATLELGLPGVTDGMMNAAKAEAAAKWAEYEARCAAREAPAPGEPDPGRNSVHFRLGCEFGILSAIADDDATAEDLIALMPEFKAKLLARKAKRGAERKRSDFLRLVVDNEVRQ